MLCFSALGFVAIWSGPKIDRRGWTSRYREQPIQLYCSCNILKEMVKALAKISLDDAVAASAGVAGAPATFGSTASMAPYAASNASEASLPEPITCSWCCCSRFFSWCFSWCFSRCRSWCCWQNTAKALRASIDNDPTLAGDFIVPNPSLNITGCF